MTEQVLCLNCGKNMVTRDLKGVEVDYCSGCGGVWFDAGELDSVTGSGGEYESVSESSGTADATDLVCPRCLSFMHKRELLKGSCVEAEQCTKCGGFFLDRGEIKTLKTYFREHRTLFTRTGYHKYPLKHEESMSPEPEQEHRQKPADVYVLDKDSMAVKALQFMTGLPVEKAPASALFTPVVSGLILVNVIVFLFTWLDGLNHWIPVLGSVPSDIVKGERLYTLLTAMFTHGGLFHIVGNMYFLFVAGDDVENVMGGLWFLLFYISGGLIADMGQLAVTPDSMIPGIGASGAISAVLGAYLIMFPKRRFHFRFFYFLFFNFEYELPVYIYLLFWFAMQFVNAEMGVKGVAWWVHIFGFVFGMMVAMTIRILKKPSV